MKRKVLPFDGSADGPCLLECGHIADGLNDEELHSTCALVECARCDERRIPTSTSLGRRTPTFDHGSVPPALLKEHRTSAWAELIVVAGSVQFSDVHPSWTAVATPGAPVVIVPDRMHQIEPDLAAEFYVQFHDLPTAV